MIIRMVFRPLGPRQKRTINITRNRAANPNTILLERHSSFKLWRHMMGIVFYDGTNDTRHLLILANVDGYDGYVYMLKYYLLD